MPNIWIKNMPSEIHTILCDRAASNHQSLQEHILEILVKIAQMPTDKELAERLREDMAAARGDQKTSNVNDEPAISDGPS